MVRTQKNVYMQLSVLIVTGSPCYDQVGSLHITTFRCVDKSIIHDNQIVKLRANNYTIEMCYLLVSTEDRDPVL